MKKIILIAVTVCLLVICSVWSGSAALREKISVNSADLAISTDFESQALSVQYTGNQSVTIKNGLPAIVRRYVVENGEFDSVSVVRVGRAPLATGLSIATEPDIATFAGDANRDDQFYSRELAKINATE